MSVVGVTVAWALQIPPKDFPVPQVLPSHTQYRRIRRYKSDMPTMRSSGLFPDRRPSESKVTGRGA